MLDKKEKAACESGLLFLSLFIVVYCGNASGQAHPDW
jgi:hypothetical protein